MLTMLVHGLYLTMVLQVINLLIVLATVEEHLIKHNYTKFVVLLFIIWCGDDFMMAITFK